MATPSSSLATLRPDLADSLQQFDLANDRAGFVGYQILRPIEVDVQSGTYGVIPIEQLLENRDTTRANGSGYARSSFEFEPASFHTTEYGAEEPVDDRESRMYRRYFDHELVSAQRALDVVLRNGERRVVTKVLDAAVITNTAAAAALWSNKTTGTPIADIHAAVDAFWEATGLWPNAVAMHRLAFRFARETDEFVNKAKFQGFMDVRSGSVTAEQMALVLDIPRVIVAGSAKNTAAKGQSAAIAPVWDKTQVLVARIAETDDPKEPCIGRTFHWGEDGSSIGGTVESYRDEKVRGNVVRVRHDVGETIMYDAMGYRITGVLS